MKNLLKLFLLVAALVPVLAPGCTGEVGDTGAVSCPTGQMDCGHRCVDISSDAANCGQCGTACAPGSLCQASACTALCAMGEAQCEGRCTAVQSDVGHCGSCSITCAAGQFCSGGQCGATCAFQKCSVDGRVDCADTMSNARHCGSCDHSCPAGQSCVNGACSLICPEGRLACSGQCIDVMSDARHCGKCDVGCNGADPCIAGHCGCPDGSELCSGACIDVREDPGNCGDCARHCAADQLCDMGTCRPKAAGCSSGLTACGSSCIDTATNDAHCGGCDQRCEANKACKSGACVCAAGKNQCGTACVDFATDSANCGTCDNACSGGQTCQQGECVCPTGETFCGAKCVDTHTSNDNCGTCGNACSGGRVCAGGQCACPSGQQLCGDRCVDIQKDELNCGACGQACSLGQACTTGHCGGGGVLREDGCQGLAQNLTVTQVAAYQTVRIVLYQNGVEVPLASRNTDVITGRDAMIRVLVTVGSGWTARDLSARVFIQNSDSVDVFYAKKSLSGSSVESSLDQSFQITVPKAKITKQTRYAVELVECGGAASGGEKAPRAPASDGLDLGARDTGILKIHIVPLQANNMVPDTSAAALDVYKNYILATYPITDLQFTVGDPLTLASATDWAGNLDKVRAVRQSDAPPPDVYYFGLLKAANTLREFCGTACTTGIGYVPTGSGSRAAAQLAAMGIGFGDSVSAETMAHEVGHNHGRQHAPCGNPSGVDPNFPDATGKVGVYGYDARNPPRLIAPASTDIMGYCNNKWFSDYTYDAILNRVATVNGATFEATLGPLSTFRVLLLDGAGPRWGIPIDKPSLPAGEPESADVLDVSGSVVEVVTVYRTEISDIGAYSIEVPAPKPGWHSIRVRRAQAYPFGAPTVTP